MRARNVWGIGLLLGLGLVPAGTRGADEKTPALTPQALRDKLGEKLTGEESRALAERVRTWFGADRLRAGAATKIEELEVAWAIEAPDAKAAEIVSTDGNFRLPLTRLGQTDVFAGTVPLPEGTALRWVYQVDGKAIPIPRAANPQQQ